MLRYKPLNITININLLTMNKAQLVAEIQKSLGSDTSKAAAERALEAVLEASKKALRKTKAFN